MMSASAMCGIRLLRGQHQFNIVVPVRHFQIDPGKYISRAAAPPKLSEPKDISVELILGVELCNDQSDVCDPL